MNTTKKEIITLGGLPGAGKSTVRDLLVAELGYDFFYTGGFMRSLAEARGIQFDEFNKLIATDKSIDEEIDAEQIKIGKEKSEFVVDAVLGYHFIPDSFKVFLTVPPDEAARRIYGDSDNLTRKNVGDTMASIAETKERIASRLSNHKDRYGRHYNTNPYDVTQYDFIIDTYQTPPEVVTKKIIEFYKEWLSR